MRQPAFRSRLCSVFVTRITFLGAACRSGVKVWRVLSRPLGDDKQRKREDPWQMRRERRPFLLISSQSQHLRRSCGRWNCRSFRVHRSLLELSGCRRGCLVSKARVKPSVREQRRGNSHAGADVSQRSAGHGTSVGVCGDWRERKRAARCVCRSTGPADARGARAFGAGRADGSVSNRRSLRRRELPAFRWEEVSAGGQAGADIACGCDCASSVQPAERLYVVASGGNSRVLAVSTSRDANVWGERNDDRCGETADESRVGVVRLIGSIISISRKAREGSEPAT